LDAGLTLEGCRAPGMSLDLVIPSRNSEETVWNWTPLVSSPILLAKVLSDASTETICHRQTCLPSALRLREVPAIRTDTANVADISVRKPPAISDHLLFVSQRPSAYGR